jgi:hypothetical protein
METLLYIILGKIIALLGVKYFGAARSKRIVETAGKILGDPKNPITDVRKAVEQALIAEEFKSMDSAVAELEHQQRAGELRIRAAEERARQDARELGTPNVTIVPRDGSEEFRSPWDEKPK